MFARAGRIEIDWSTGEQNYYGEVALATLPRDRWGALGLYPGAEEGTVWSTPVTLPPHRMHSSRIS